MSELIAALLTNGPLGLFAGIILKMYLDEKKQSREKIDDLNDKIQEILSNQSTTLADIYSKQNKREEEINATLKDYGQGLVDAVERAHETASVLEKTRDRIWNARK